MINLIEYWFLISFGLLFILILFTSHYTYQVKKFHKNLSTTISLVTLTKTNQSFQLTEHIS